MTKNKKIVTGVIVTAIILYMIRTRIAKALNKTPFAVVSDRLFNLISKLEGSFQAVPYWDFQQWSVGFGSGYNWDEKRAVVKSDVIDLATAKRWLNKEAEQEYDYVMSKVRVPVTDNQLLALASFSYNVGQGAFANSNLLRMLNAGTDKVLVAKEFDKWVNAGGKVSQGLVNRRKQEKNLFLSIF